MEIRLDVICSCITFLSFSLFFFLCLFLSFTLLLVHPQFPSLRCELLLLMKTTAFQSSFSPFTARMAYQKLWRQLPPCCKVRHLTIPAHSFCFTFITSKDSGLLLCKFNFNQIKVKVANCDSLINSDLYFTMFPSIGYPSIMLVFPLVQGNITKCTSVLLSSDNM